MGSSERWRIPYGWQYSLRAQKAPNNPHRHLLPEFAGQRQSSADPNFERKENERKTKKVLRVEALIGVGQAGWLPEEGFGFGPLSREYSWQFPFPGDLFLRSLANLGRQGVLEEQYV